MKIKSLLRAAAGLAVLASFGAAHADTYALLVGINDYPEPVDSNGNPIMKDGKPVTSDLKGCVNDVNSMKAAFVSKFGVSEANIKVLTDGQANAAGFIEGMKWLLGVAKPGDQIIFDYSGHGGQIPVEKSDLEPDGLDEVIVLADDKLVTDNLFSELAKSLANKGVNATFIFDSCHSGGMSRDPNPNRVLQTKYVSLPRSAKARALSAPTLNGLKAIPRGIVTGTGQEKGTYAFLFASKEEQTSSDVSFKDNSKPAHGVFTLILLAALEQKPEFDLEALEMLIAEILKEAKYTQVPNFEYSSAARSKQALVWK